MVKQPWFRCFPSNFLIGTAGMPPLLFKAYTRLIMLLYEHGGPLPYERARLASLLELRPQDVDRLLDELVARGKISLEGGLIHNVRTDHEIGRNSLAEASATGSAEAVQRPSSAPSNASADRAATPKQRPSHAKKTNESYARAGDHTHERAPAQAHSPPEAEAEERRAPPSAESPSFKELTLKVVPTRSEPPELSEAEEAAALAALRLKASSQEPPSSALLRSKLVTEPTGSSLFDRLNAATEKPNGRS